MPSPSSFQIDCPSGLKFSARRLRVQEMMGLARAAESNAADGGLTNLIASVWEDVIEPGPAYPAFAAGTKPILTKMLDGDVTVALLKLRVTSIGPLYQNFRPICEGCGRKQEPLTVDLTAWDETPYPSSTIEAYVAGKALETTLPRSGLVKFVPPDMSQYGRLVGAKKRWQKRLYEKKDPGAPKALRAQDFDFIPRCVTFVEALGERSRDALSLIEWAVQLELDEFYALRDAVNGSSGGIETKFSFTCCYANCGADQEQDVPFAGDFFRPPPPSKKTTADESEAEDTETKEAAPPTATA